MSLLLVSLGRMSLCRMRLRATGRWLQVSDVTQTVHGDRPARKPKAPKIPRTDMPCQPAKQRAANFEEVTLGYDADMAMLEASRCLLCKKPKCVLGCPVGIDIPAVVRMIAAGDPAGAIAKLKETTSFPAVCGRVCPQEEQCEQLCVLGVKQEPVAIGRLERYAADWEFAHGATGKDAATTPQMAPRKGKHVGVVGSGPAGLTCVGELAKMGYDVTIYEALHKPGGVLVYGIPEFRLPKAIVARECEYVESLGVELKMDHVIGRTLTVDQMLADGHDAVFLANGAGLPSFMNIPGENLNGVYSANEFLTRSNLMKAYRFPEYDTPIAVGKKVAVIGGGNVAMDAARTALRLGPRCTSSTAGLSTRCRRALRRSTTRKRKASSSTCWPTRRRSSAMPMAGSRRLRSSTWSWVNRTRAVAGAPCLLMAPRGASPSTW